MKKALAVAVVLVALIVGWQSRRRAASAEMLDLVSELRVADLRAETSFIDVGAPSGHEHLIAGWGTDEQDSRGTYRWVVGETALVSFLSTEPKRVDMGLDCEPLVFDGMPTQIVKIKLNGETLGEIRLGQARQNHKMAIPADAILMGENLAELEPTSHHRPWDVLPGAEDQRPLAFRCYGLSLDGLGAAESIRVGGSADGHEDRIHLPVGTSITYYFDYDETSQLIVPRLETWGPRAAPLSLLIRFTPADGLGETHQRLSVPGPDPEDVLRVPLASAGRGTGRLVLAATSAADRRPTTTSGITLVQPAIRSQLDVEQPAERRALPASRPTARRAPRPHIIVYLIDTLRADHLGVYGYHRPTSPNIDRFAADAVLFENASAQSSWTRPAVASLLTGLAPRAHGVHQVQDRLPDSVETLAEALTQHGYVTAAFVTNGNVNSEFGMDRGFLDFRYLRESKERASHHQLSDQLNTSLFRWLEDRPAERPFFLYAHATDPHAPYTPPEPFLGRFAPNAEAGVGSLDRVRKIHLGQRQVSDRTRGDLIDLYDAEIAFNDHHFGRLLERLKELGLYDSSLILLISDHGEEFFDHGGWGHGNSLYQEQLAVPLILKLPGNQRAGERIRSLANQTDVMPTLLELLDLPVPASITGRNLLSDDEFNGNSSFAYLSRLEDRVIRSVTREGWKLILNQGAGSTSGPVQLYQVAVDSRETTDLAHRRPFEAGLLAQILRRWELGFLRPGAGEGVEVPISTELRDRLEALGYL